ncbi:MAG: FIG00452884: hypothetical protein [uncultured Paraburkholderia sp.]|nr:MAG: FIG00452884: hypothetical protein [uncultured Paraburkholderia sp.]
MIVHGGIMISYGMVAFVCLGVLLIGGLLCFLLLEALPALT